MDETGDLGVIQDSGIRAAFGELAERGVLRFWYVLYAGPEAGNIYVFSYRCACPDAPWRAMRMPEWKVRGEFVM